jgi:DNA-binding NarL/FixJ family response regulator
MFVSCRRMDDLETILLVEDDQLTARSVQRLLKRVRAQVVHVSSCAAARALSRRFVRGVFDIELGDGDGVSLAAELLSNDSVEGVVFYTACTSPDLLSEAARLGEVVLKGAPGPVLLEAISRSTRPRSNTPPAYGVEKTDRSSSSG